MAVSNGHIIGTAADGRPDRVNDTKLAQLYVLPAAQRIGVGRTLLEAFIAEFPLAQRITLEVEPQNTCAIAFYMRHDFIEVGEVDNCGNATNGIRAIVMAKQITT